MRHLRTMMAAALAGACAGGPATAEEARTRGAYVGFTAELRSDIDPGDYEHIARDFTARRDGSGATGFYLGRRWGRFALEGGWTFGRKTRWTKTTTSATGVNTVHAAEIESGGQYIAAIIDVAAVKQARLYVKGGLAGGNSWRTSRNAKTTGSGCGSTIATTGAGARLELPESGLELRAGFSPPLTRRKSYSATTPTWGRKVP